MRVILIILCLTSGAGCEGEAGNFKETDAGLRCCLDAGLGDAPLSTDDASINQWAVHNPDIARVEQWDDSLSIEMLRPALWFDSQESVLVYRLLEGDFSFQAQVRARRTSAPGSPPGSLIHLAGLMARDPSGARENHVFVVVGFDVNDLSVETKTTRDGESVFEGPSWSSGDAELRLCRTGSVFELYKREIGSPTWLLAQTYNRPDLPPRLQVGANAYAQSGPDLRAEFSSIAFGAGCD